MQATNAEYNNTIIEKYEKLPVIYISQPQYKNFWEVFKRIISGKGIGGGVVGVITLTKILVLIFGEFLRELWREFWRGHGKGTPKPEIIGFFQYDWKVNIPVDKFFNRPIFCKKKIEASLPNNFKIKKEWLQSLFVRVNWLNEFSQRS